MGLPWFSNTKKSPAESPLPRSKKMSSRGGRNSFSRKNIMSTGSDRAPTNFPLPSAAELQNVFNKFDANGDGKISSSELSNVMRSLGHDPTEEELRLMMAEADADGDGYVDLSEFVALNTQGVDCGVGLRDMKDAFKMFDVDGNGSISADELHRVMRRLGESCSLDECRRMIGGVDADGDGLVSLDEFLTMMTTSNTM